MRFTVLSNDAYEEARIIANLLNDKTKGHTYVTNEKVTMALTHVIICPDLDHLQDRKKLLLRKIKESCLAEVVKASTVLPFLFETGLARASRLAKTLSDAVDNHHSSRHVLKGHCEEGVEWRWSLLLLLHGSSACAGGSRSGSSSFRPLFWARFSQGLRSSSRSSANELWVRRRILGAF